MAVKRRQVYETEAQAFERVEILKRKMGVWTGITRLPGGEWVLLFDPPTRSGSRYTDISMPEAEL